VKLNADGSIVYSTYFGGNGDDNGVGVSVDGGVAVDAAGNAYITGSTSSSNLPTLNAYQAVYGGNTDFAGWRLVGFPGGQAVYTPADLQNRQAFTRAPMIGLQSRAGKAPTT